MQPIDIDFGGGQYTHYHPYDSSDTGAAKPDIDAARTRFASLPFLLQAIEENANFWIHKEEEDKLTDL
jgi:hypothetical protein